MRDVVFTLRCITIGESNKRNNQNAKTLKLNNVLFEIKIYR